MQSKAYRSLKYFSASTASISIGVTPLGGSTSTYSGSCTTASCSVSFTANPGPNTLTFTLKDASNTVLSTFSTLDIVQPGTINTLNYTANPVVKSVVASLASSSVNACSPSNDLLTVNALDADNNIIVGNSSYLDTNGNPIAITLDVTDVQNGGKGTVSIQGPSYITSPAQSAIYAHYDGNWLSSSTIAVTTNSTAVSSLTNATLTTTPHITEYSSGISGCPPELTVGSDGNIWFGEECSNKIGRITMSGSVVEFSTAAGVTNANGIDGLTTGPDGNIWYTHEGTSVIGRITTAGVATEWSSPAGSIQIALGPDGNLWATTYFSEAIQRITPTKSSPLITNYSGSFVPDYIISANGALWFSDPYFGAIGKITTQGNVIEYTSGFSGLTPVGLCLGPDGNIWFTENGANAIGKMNTNGTILASYSGPTSSANLQEIVLGPDGNMWFTENAGRIGMITPTGTVSEYTSGMVSGATPRGIVVGPDGNIWFTDHGGRIGKLVL